MPPPPTPTSARAIGAPLPNYFLPLLLGLSLSGCALFKPSETAAKKKGSLRHEMSIDGSEVKWMAQLEEQRAETARLEAKLDALRRDLATDKATKIASRTASKTRRLPVQNDWDDEFFKATDSREARARTKEKQLPIVKLKPQPEASGDAEPKYDAESDVLADTGDTDESERPPLDRLETVVDSSHEEMTRFFEGAERFRQGQYDRALLAFRAFLDGNPDHPYADRAEYHILEAHSRNREWTSVIRASSRIESTYPHSFFVGEALLQRASAYTELHETAKARETLRAILRRFPGDPVADRASRRLADLGESAPARRSVSEAPRLPLTPSVPTREARLRPRPPLLQDVP